MLLKFCNRLSILTAACLIILSGCEPISFDNPWEETPVNEDSSYSDKLPQDPHKDLPKRLQKDLKANSDSERNEIRAFDANPRLMQGYGFNVVLDGNASLPGAKKQARQMWQIKKPISANPTLNLSVSEKMGELNRIIITINPYENGKLNRNTLWKLSKELRKALKPNSAIKFSAFQGVNNETKIDPKTGKEMPTFFQASQLPAGKYRMRLQIIGDMVDEQNIDFTVK